MTENIENPVRQTTTESTSTHTVQQIDEAAPVPGQPADPNAAKVTTVRPAEVATEPPKQ